MFIQIKILLMHISTISFKFMMKSERKSTPAEEVIIASPQGDYPKSTSFSVTRITPSRHVRVYKFTLTSKDGPLIYRVYL